jgi:hypothetical protein
MIFIIAKYHIISLAISSLEMDLNEGCNDNNKEEKNCESTNERILHTIIHIIRIQSYGDSNSIHPFD